MSKPDADIEALALRVRNLEFEMLSRHRFLWVFSAQILCTVCGAGLVIGTVATYAISGLSAAIAFADRLVSLTVAAIMLVSVIIWIATTLSEWLITEP